MLGEVGGVTKRMASASSNEVCTRRILRIGNVVVDAGADAGLFVSGRRDGREGGGEGDSSWDWGDVAEIRSCVI